MEYPSPSLVDTHSHVSSPAFGDDRAEALERARAAGVTLVVDVGTEPEEWEASLKLAWMHEGVRCVLGLHPNSASGWSSDVRKRLLTLLTDPLVVGIGETGLDYYRLGAPVETQQEVFKAHLVISQDMSLPVIIHAREAYDDILNIVERHGAGTVGVMHSFAGSVEQAMRAVSLGYYISISGPATYKSGGNIRAVAAATPLDRLLVETDSPYLPPHPHRGQRNEPAFVALTAAAVAAARGMSLEELAGATTANVHTLFDL